MYHVLRRATCPAHPVLLDFISLVKSTNYEVSHYARSLVPVPPSLLDPNIHLPDVLFSYTVNLSLLWEAKSQTNLTGF